LRVAWCLRTTTLNLWSVTPTIRPGLSALFGKHHVCFEAFVTNHVTRSCTSCTASSLSKFCIIAPSMSVGLVGRSTMFLGDLLSSSSCMGFFAWANDTSKLMPTNKSPLIGEWSYLACKQFPCHLIVSKSVRLFVPFSHKYLGMYLLRPYLECSLCGWWHLPGHSAEPMEPNLWRLSYPHLYSVAAHRPQSEFTSKQWSRSHVQRKSEGVQQESARGGGSELGGCWHHMSMEMI